MLKEKTGMPAVDRTHRAVNDAQRWITTELYRRDPIRRPALVGAVIAMMPGSVTALTMFDAISWFIPAAILALAPMAAFIAWVEPRNQRIICEELLPGVASTWTEAVRAFCDAAAAKSGSPRQPAPRAPIGFRLPG